MSRLLAAVVVALAFAAPAPAQERTDAGAEMVARQVAGLQAQVATLEKALRARDDRLDEMARDVKELRADAGATRPPSPSALAAPFLAAPSTSSDLAGVSKSAVFAPRVQVDSVRSHDALELHVQRVEASGLHPVGDAAVGRDETSVDLPLDQNGALYVVLWSTSEGHTYSIALIDGASGQTVATVQVKPQQSEGRLIFVGYKLD